MTTTSHNIAHNNNNNVYDIVIIGGGINGCGIARDAAGRGLKVLLAEKDDLAQGTSSSSTKLIHGGLRYLEHYEFGLVREALTERERLLNIAPHLIRPLRFVLPHHKALRPAWLLRLGLFMYDHMGGRKLLPATQKLNLKQHEAGKPLIDEFSQGFEYSDCWVDDARLVALNALDAKQRGATILTQTECTQAQRVDKLWQVTLHDKQNQTHRVIKTRSLINAAGPWVDKLLALTETEQNKQTNIRLVRGSHIIVPALYQHDKAYIFQNADGRIIFAIPYEQDYTLLGTTDSDHKTSLDEVAISESEIQYICDAASEYFKQPIKSRDVVWTYSGVRSLYNDGASKAQEATRDYVLKIEKPDQQAPLLSIFGGKITTYRHLAEDALTQLSPLLNHTSTDWTKEKSLPGGEFAPHEVDDYITRLQNDYDFLDTPWATSLIRRYGTRAWQVLADAKTHDDLGEHFGATLTEQEARFLMTEEWANQADDILWRRSKLGLHMNEEQRQHFTQWFASHHYIFAPA